jgi:hypothetical protein
MSNPTGETPRLEGYAYIDKNRKPVVDGARVAVQHCTGRYGQTQLHEGKLLRITSTSVWIELDTGDPLFIPGVFHLDRQEAKTLTGYNKHEDYEHGHETWLQVLPR